MPFIIRRTALTIAAALLLPFCSTQLIAPVPGWSGPGDASQSSSTGVVPQQLAGGTVKILVCGDSISQGQEGDFTWRYRLWEWFRSNAAQHSSSAASSSSSSSSSITPSLEYVGPFNGTLPVASAGNPSSSVIQVDASKPQTWGAYHRDVDPAFSPVGNGSRHFAVYGRPAWLNVDKIRGQVETYKPDMVVLHLGFNDFGWWSNTAADLLESMAKLVFNARLGKRDVAVLIADVSHRLLVAGRDDIPVTTEAYNKMLAEKADEWSTPESPVVVVRVSEEYACHVESCPAGIDGLHPNALGDFQIARAYTKVLHEQFLFGAGPLVVPRLKNIPGMKAATKFSPMDTLLYLPVGIFIGMSILYLIILRPRWLRGGRVWGAKYERLPIIRERKEWL